MDQKGISSIAIILIIFGVSIIIAGIWAWQNQKEKPVACPQDTKLCPDGSSVFRTGPNCEFASCPEVKEEAVKEAKEKIVKETKDETANWKTYQNEQYSFELKYPTSFKIISDKRNEDYKIWFGACPIIHNVVFINPSLQPLVWEAGVQGRIPELRVSILQVDCKSIFDNKSPLPKNASDAIAKLTNLGIPPSRIPEAIFTGLAWDEFGNPEQRCEEVSVIAVNNHYAVKSQRWMTGPLYPQTRAVFVPDNSFMISLNDEASAYNEVFDQILSTFKFIK